MELGSLMADFGYIFHNSSVLKLPVVEKYHKITVRQGGMFSCSLHDDNGNGSLKLIHMSALVEKLVYDAIVSSNNPLEEIVTGF